MSKLNTPYISIVIPAKNEANYIGICLESIKNINYPSSRYEVIVVDNNSTDKTAEIANRYDIKLFPWAGRTISSVRNFGVSQTCGDILAFLDADSIPDPDWLIEGIKVLQTDSVSAVGFVMELPSPEASWVERVFSDNFGGRQKTSEVSYLSSFNILVKKKYFTQVNGFDETLETCEDADFGFRLSKISQLILSDKISIKHLGTIKTLKELFFKELWRGKGNLFSFVKNKKTFSNTLSTLTPLVFVLTNITGLILFLYSLRYAFLVLLAAQILPVAMVLYKASNISRNNVLKIWIVSFVYLMARGLAFFK